MSKRFLQGGLGLLGLLVISASLGCGGGGVANLRILDAAPNEPEENTLIDGNVVNSNLAYLANTGYISVTSGSRHLQVEPVNSTTPVVDTTLTLADTTNTTVIVAGVATVTPIVLTDQTTVPTSGTAVIRLVNAAPSMGSADVYVVPDGTSIAGTSPLVSGVSFQTASSYQSLTITAGTSTNYDIYFTEPGTQLALLTTGPISITSGEALTVVSMNGLGGGFTFTALTDLQ
jgi:hypothetical protein